jgi:hypothetical protein
LEWLKAVNYWPDDMDFTIPGAKPVHVRDLAPSTPASPVAPTVAPTTTTPVATSTPMITPKKHNKEKNTPTMYVFINSLPSFLRVIANDEQ